MNDHDKWHEEIGQDINVITTVLLGLTIIAAFVILAIATSCQARLDRLENQDGVSCGSTGFWDPRKWDDLICPTITPTPDE